MVGTVCTRPFEFLSTVASRQQTHAERRCPASGQQVPDAITDHDTLANRHMGCSAAVRNKSGSGLALHLIASYHRRAGRQLQQLQRMLCALQPSAGRDGIGHTTRRQRIQQILRAGNMRSEGACLTNASACTR